MTAPLDEKGMEAARDAFEEVAGTVTSALALRRAVATYLSAVAPPDELEVDWDRLRELIGEYFDLGYAEGVVQRDVDTMAGDAQRTLTEIEAIISQAHSTIAALRVERDYNAKMAEYYDANALRWCERAETAEAEVKRLTEEKEALDRHNQALLDKVSSEDCACAYDHPDDVCLGHSPKLKAAEARIKALEEVVLRADEKSNNWMQAIAVTASDVRATRAVLNSREKADG